ncbi:MAG: ABC transporter ATP-binding protein [Candidatus Micrarchaeota archaeon]
MAEETAVSARNVSKFFGSKKALNEVSFSIPRGSVFCIAGPNGSGKTTLLNIITKTTLPSEGILELNNSIGYCYQSPRVCDDLTVKENIDFFFDIGASKSEEWKRKVLKITALEPWLNARADSLSTGTRKRLELAISLISNPEILVLDEPTTGLDSESSNRIVDLVRSFRGRKTVILATHQLGDFESVCDYLLILVDGRAVFLSQTNGAKAKLNLTEVYKKYVKE